MSLPVNRQVNKDAQAWQFFGLVLLLSLPFYALGALSAALPFAEALPLSALMAVVPVIAKCLVGCGCPWFYADGFRADGWNGLVLRRRIACNTCTSSQNNSPRLCIIFLGGSWRGTWLAGLCQSPPYPAVFGIAGGDDHRRGMGALARHPVCDDGAQHNVDCLARVCDGVDADHHRLACRKHAWKHPGLRVVSYDEQQRLGIFCRLQPVV
jgi:hypothetical protein